MVVRKAEERPVPQNGWWLVGQIPAVSWRGVGAGQNEWGRAHNPHDPSQARFLSTVQGLKCGEAPTNTRWRKSGTEKANGDFPSIARSMTGGERTLAQVQGLKHGRWHGQWVQLANATTAEFLHTSDVIPQVRSPSGRVMKLCHFDAVFTLS